MPGDALKPCILDDRALLCVSGEDAFDFLQNIVTNDMKPVAEGGLRYACLLGPQGRFLHEFFVLPDGAGGFFLDCAASGIDDLQRRLAMYKLRARAALGRAEGWQVRAAPEKSGQAFPDPRLGSLGFRVYTRDRMEGQGAAFYHDFCIARGVPSALGMRKDKDFLADINLDLLNAVSFDKGCFIGQELTARMHHRGLAKKRLLIVEGEALAAGDKILRGETEVGEVRETNAAATRSLALLRLDSADAELHIAGRGRVSAQRPAYMKG
jgi:folate-binding protein YgfZ